MAYNNVIVRKSSVESHKDDEIKFEDKSEKGREGKMQQSDLAPDQIAEF